MALHRRTRNPVLNVLNPAWWLRNPTRFAWASLSLVFLLYVWMERNTANSELDDITATIGKLEGVAQHDAAGRGRAQEGGGEGLERNAEQSARLAAEAASLAKQVVQLAEALTDGRELGEMPEEVAMDVQLPNEFPQATEDVTTQRREQVKAAMRHSWMGYERFAFKSDELCPLTRKGKNMFGGMGATVIDSLDTLYIMGLKDEYAKARQFVARDMTFNRPFDASVFETIIRVLGGMLSAYYLSGDTMYVRRGLELADLLMPAFDTPTGIPYNVLNLRTQKAKNPNWTKGASTLAEFGTTQLEMVALSRESGNPKYARASLNCINVVESRMPGGGLVPLFLNPQTGQFTSQHYSFGAMGDSYYEYLLKMWIQGGKTQAVRRYLNMWERSMDQMIDQLVQYSSPGGYAYVAERKNGRLYRKMDHLACFVPGMLALGAPDVPKKADKYMKVAGEIMRTCYQFYKMQPTGLSAEMYNFPENGDMVSGAHHNLLRPETVESLTIMWRRTGNNIFREWGWEIFQSFEKHCRVPTGGYAGIKDVRKPVPVQDDTMQSFWLAETMKYFYLLFSSDEVISLDEWVFNTEAHPLKIIKHD